MKGGVPDSCRRSQIHSGEVPDLFTEGSQIHLERVTDSFKGGLDSFKGDWFFRWMHICIYVFCKILSIFINQ